jgi:hypothetical protein
VANRGGVFFGDFLLAAQKKVTSRRSATGDFTLSIAPSTSYMH